MIFPAHNYHGGKWVDRIGSCDQFEARSDDLFICCVPRSGNLSNMGVSLLRSVHYVFVTKSRKTSHATCTHLLSNNS